MDEIVLGRVGHYHVPSGAGDGSCQLAIVAYVHPVAVGSIRSVNLAAFEHDGEPFRRLDVPVTGVAAGDRAASFHLTRDCPWGR